MLMNAISLILPTHLFSDNPCLDKTRRVIVYEAPRYFSDFNFHPYKLIFHRSSMQSYEDLLEKKGHKVEYISQDQDIFGYLLKHKITHIHMIDPVDTPFEKMFFNRCAHYGITLIIYTSPAFLLSRKDIEEYFSSKEKFHLAGFYQHQRKKFSLLIDNGKPYGGKWSFDPENRRPLPKNEAITMPWQPKATQYSRDAAYALSGKYNRSINLNNFFYATTHQSAEKTLEDFLEKRFKKFGPYQDAINTNMTFGYHSVISPLLNTGLLTPDHVIKKSIDYALHEKVPLNSLEGFVRQIVGWREFVRAVYHIFPEQRDHNFFNHTAQLTEHWWRGDTGLEPVDYVIKKVHTFAYAHHIERLMVMGNCMLLCQIDPHAVYRWFMEFFIDAYDWVMVPNVYGMSQYADGGKMVTKPYISGSAYILRMSNFKRDTWCTLWNALYWSFVHKHQRFFLENPRLRMTTLYLKKVPADTMHNYIKLAKHIVTQITS